MNKLFELKGIFRLYAENIDDAYHKICEDLDTGNWNISLYKETEPIKESGTYMVLKGIL